MEEEGQGMTEYGLILGMLVVVIVVAFAVLTDEFTAIFEGIVKSITGATTTTEG
ncbi:Flp family type IVb pilin [Salinicoccus luteus]|uniref:Flp family type IVb pilin n=1 Tax=Salinicoccus luteus TaxID=367840 RepID=UPI000B121200|nr:Flp family type IVb pilin [Salinicoccus luteus]